MKKTAHLQSILMLTVSCIALFACSRAVSPARTDTLPATVIKSDTMQCAILPATVIKSNKTQTAILPATVIKSDTTHSSLKN